VFAPPLDTKLPAALADTCNPTKELSGKGLSDIFQKSLLDAAQQMDGLSTLAPWGCMVRENGLVSTSVRRVAPSYRGYGVLFVLGEKDTLVEPGIERASFDTLCSQGVAMQYLECAGASHTQATSWALPEIVDFVSDRFAGKVLDASLLCQRAPAQKCRATP
jgi:hypothetical protein